MKKRWSQPGSLFVRPHNAAPKTVWWVSFLKKFRFMRFLRGLCTFIGCIFLVSVIAGMISGIFMQQKKSLPDQMILTLRVEEGLQEITVGKGFFDLPGLVAPPLSVRDMIAALDYAAIDPRVKALAVSLDSGGAGIAQVQELRAAIKRFRSSGKPSYVFSPSYAEFGDGMGTYYLASAFEQIWLQPVGFLSLPGVNAEMPFAKAALNKLGVNPEFYQRKEYKSVMENVSRENMSPQNREMLESLLNDIVNGVVDEIATDRGLTPQSIREAMNQSVLTDQESVVAKLVDRVDYGDVLFSTIRKTLTGNAEDETLKLYDMTHYVDHIPYPDDDDEQVPMVGFVHAVGNIVANAQGGGMSSEIIAADRVAGAIMKGVRDNQIKVIVLRIDSPGGSPTASETIRRAVERAKEKGKPVIVSMGAMAGSGGYWIAVDAMRIYALPATMTGSIGVVSGKFEAAELMKKIGVNWEGIKIGENADLNSFTSPFSKSADERMNAMVDSIYDAFTARVAKGRKMTPEQVEHLARGRVWTGRQAQELGLVDELGGLDVALDHAAVLAGAKDRHNIHLVELPRPKTPFDRIFEFLNVDVAMGRFAGSASSFVRNQIRSMNAHSISVHDPMLRVLE